MARDHLNQIDAALLAIIDDDAFAGVPARTNFDYAGAINHSENRAKEALYRLRERGLIRIESHGTPRRRIYAVELGRWTDWSARADLAANGRRGIKRIPCLCCREPFLSHGKGNRLCRPCIDRDGPPWTRTDGDYRIGARP